MIDIQAVIVWLLIWSFIANLALAVLVGVGAVVIGILLL